MQKSRKRIVSAIVSASLVLGLWTGYAIPARAEENGSGQTPPTEIGECRQYFYAEHAAADLRAEHITLAADHIAFDAVTKDSRTPIKVGIPGGFMVYNTLDVLGAALALGVPLEKSARVLAAVPHVKGRVEVVPTPGKDYTVLIDYSHTPDSLENILRTVKGFAKGRTVALFGCGGDRDRTKRPIMGSVAAELADFVVVTSDNPRTEDPEAIIADILPGLEGSGTPYQVICDRVEAIHWAMDHAQPGDVIALCGKGHETYQIVGDDEADIKENRISVSSPIARALIGKYEGDSVQFMAPKGLVSYEIESVEYI